MITLANFLVIAVVALGISSMIWPPRLPILIPVAVIILGLLRYVAVIVIAAVSFALAGCATLSSPLAQGLFNTAAEQITVSTLQKNPDQIDQLAQIAHDLPTAFAMGSLTSENIGAVVGAIGRKRGAKTSTILNLSATLDGAVRNYVKQNGGDVPTLQGAIVQQIMTNFADGMKHGISLYRASIGPIPYGTPQIGPAPDGTPWHEPSPIKK